MSTSLRGALILAFIERYICYVLNFLVLAIVSRLLTPAEIGLAVLGTAILSVAECIRDGGASNYLVQSREISLLHIRTAFTVMLALTISLSLLIFSFSTMVASYYQNDSLIPYFELIALSFMASPFSGTILALMRRNLEFGRLALISIATQTIGGAVTIGLAALGFGYMSFAWAALATSIAGAAFAILAKPDLRLFRPSIADWQSVLTFGGVSSATVIVNRFYEMLPFLVMGRVLPIDSIGLYSRAQSFCQMADKVVFAGIGSVALPALAQEAREGRNLRDAYLKALSYITGVYWPILILLALLAHPAVLLVLGQQWLEIVPMVQVMAIATLFFFPAVLSYPTLVAAGGVSDTLRASLISLVPSALIMAAAAGHGPFAVAASQLLTIPLQVFVVLWFIRRRVYFSWLDLLVAVHKSAIVTLGSMIAPAMIIVGFGDGLEVSLPVAVFSIFGACAGWLITIMAVKHQLRSELGLGLRLLSNQLRRLRPA